VIAKASPVEAHHINVTLLHVTVTTAKERIQGGDTTPSDVAQAGLG
jgi:hypothetical protein